MNLSFVTTTFSGSLSNALTSLRNAGILIAAAAGNDGVNNDVTPYYPASFKIDNILSVTSTTRTDDFYGFHNYGASSVHLAAPGVDIFSTYNSSDSSYGSMTGTSMASPMVAAAAAMIWARSPQLTHQQVMARILGTVDRLPGLSGRCISGGRLNLDRAVGPREFIMTPGVFSWVPTNGLTPLVLENNGVTAALPLGFAFDYFGQTRTEVYVSANGMLGFESAGLAMQFDVSLPATNVPNNTLYVYWDDLNPAAGGRVWVGNLGVAPHRKFVVSWVDVPHTTTAGGETRSTVQAVLHETGEIAFQYLDIENGRTAFSFGRSASVGLEDSLGLTAVTYTFHGTPALVTNRLALVFTPKGTPIRQPSLAADFPVAGLVPVRCFGQPGQRCVEEFSLDAETWFPAATNVFPAGGILQTDWLPTAPQRFFRAGLLP
jgi:hypothetical protein